MQYIRPVQCAHRCNRGVARSGFPALDRGQVLAGLSCGASAWLAESVGRGDLHRNVFRQLAVPPVVCGKDRSDKVVNDGDRVTHTVRRSVVNRCRSGPSNVGGTRAPLMCWLEDVLRGIFLMVLRGEERRTLLGGRDKGNATCPSCVAWSVTGTEEDVCSVSEIAFVNELERNEGRTTTSGRRLALKSVGNHGLPYQPCDG